MHTITQTHETTRTHMMMKSKSLIWLVKRNGYLILSIFLSCTLLKLGNTTAYAQEKQTVHSQATYSITIRQQNLITVFSKIEELTPYTFNYSDAIEDRSKLYSFDFVNQTIDQLVKQLAEKANLQYKRKGNQITVKAKLTTNKVNDANQELIEVSGKIIDKETQEALIGVSVILEGTQQGTFTDLEGKYRLKVPLNSFIYTNYYGYLPVTKKATNQHDVDFSLQIDNKSLEEIVIVGYGEVQKKDVVGSVGIVDMKDLAKAPVNAFDQALAGRIAGVQVSSMEDGQPGAGMNIVIRGQGSLTQSTQPLYVIDGVPIEDFDNSSLNPDDIASITILKDASETAIYGARGANGVIVIETKTGEVLNANRIIFEGNPTRVKRLNQYASYANRWTPDNQNNEMYRVNGEGPEVISSRTIEDASYLRLKTISLGYTFPKSITNKLRLTHLGVSLAAQNLFTWTKYSGMDPEVSVHNSVLTPGFDFSAYPHARRLVFGLNLTF